MFNGLARLLLVAAVLSGTHAKVSINVYIICMVVYFENGPYQIIHPSVFVSHCAIS